MQGRALRSRPVRRIHIHQTRGDCVTIDLRPDRERMAAWVAALVAMASLNVWLAAPLWLLALDAVVLPVIVIGLRRAATRHQRTLVRAQGRLLLDGEPLEMARVELRVREWPFTRVPRGYSLSLWVMTASGPEDLPVGHFDHARSLAAIVGVGFELECPAPVHGG